MSACVPKQLRETDHPPPWASASPYRPHPGRLGQLPPSHTTEEDPGQRRLRLSRQLKILTWVFSLNRKEIQLTPPQSPSFWVLSGRPEDLTQTQLLGHGADAALSLSSGGWSHDLGVGDTPEGIPGAAGGPGWHLADPGSQGTTHPDRHWASVEHRSPRTRATRWPIEQEVGGEALMLRATGLLT